MNEKEKLKKENEKLWRKPKVGRINYETGEKFTKKSAEEKIKKDRADRINLILPNYEGS